MRGTAAKNGTYLTLVKDVRKAMKTDELVKVDCKGLNPSDMKRIGAKLKVSHPCHCFCVPCALSGLSLSSFCS
jgi:hypothetical protein